jgi:formylglycine-generating enzyme required for sulfatase activity
MLRTSYTAEALGRMHDEPDEDETPSSGPASQRPTPQRLRDQSGANKASPPPIPLSELDESPAPWRERLRRARPLSVPAAMFGALVLGVIAYAATDKGRITMVVNDPTAIVKIDGEEVRLKALGVPISITLRAGAHTFAVKRGNGELMTRRIVVRRGGNEDVRIENEPVRISRATPSRQKLEAVKMPVLPDEPKAIGNPFERFADVKSAASPQPQGKPSAGKEPLARSILEKPVLAEISKAKNAETRTREAGVEKTVPPKPATSILGMKLMLIPAGEFLMGSPEGQKDADANESPQHRVQITRPFYLGVYEVTQGQYRAITGESPSHFRSLRLEESESRPVESVSWGDAIAFCNKLSEREGLKPYYQFGPGAKSGGDGYRLPTEAEWEYACRAGSTTRFSFGDDAASLEKYAWLSGDYGPTSVGQLQSNAWGLHDMHGNVDEWCWDGYESNYYARSPDADPTGPSRAASRVCRSGSGWGHVERCRSAYRNGLAPGYRDRSLGFRVARFPSGR